MIPSVVPSPTHVELHYAALNDVNFMAIYTEQLIDFRTVETLFLFGTMSKYLVKLPITPKEHRVQFVTDRLHTLNLNVGVIENVRFVAPNLRHLHLAVHSKEHLNFLLEFMDQLHTLIIKFFSKEVFYFYTLSLGNLRHLSIDRWEKAMTKSEQSTSIGFFKRCKRLERLEMFFKFVDSFVLHSIAANLRQLVELTLVVQEGTIQLWHISTLPVLKHLRITARHVYLHNLQLPALQSLRIGSKKGARLEGIECLMAFTRLRTLTLVNVKLYPEVQQLTPTYSVERMVLAHYDKLEDNHLLVLVKRFPALRWLHIKRCHGIDQREIDKLKRMHPKLAVAYDVPSPVALWNDGVEDRKSHEVDYTFKLRK
ncbi:AGAP012159-PA-like protein [Anopheles sinensis]|uniref:AGAP012159-PA-like protein n=1 Tax=Anopheles sinensis TaxID=74873 RepID=A0A084WM43_ANOSI|nr:AGAP012159-PA-like protein [Anopheles sinensis]